MIQKILALAVGVSLVTLICAGSIPEEWKEVAADIREFCQEESKVSTEILEKIGENPFIEDPNFKCYIKCQLSHFGVISRKGIHWNGFVRAAPPSLKDWANRVREHCETVVEHREGEDVCELAFRASKCAHDTSPSEYFLF